MVMKGFTLIEVMIVVAIIGILAAMTYPSYQESVRKSKRADMQSQLLDAAAKMQKYRIANFTFFKPGTTTAIALSDIGVASTYPVSGQQLYDIELKNVTAGYWLLEAKPKANTMQAPDGAIALNSRGERCWTKGASSCTPSATSNWDGR
ncbi:MAG: type IV pilin protein [Acinetobacter sp.]